MSKRGITAATIPLGSAINQIVIIEKLKLNWWVTITLCSKAVHTVSAFFFGKTSRTVQYRNQSFLSSMYSRWIPPAFRTTISSLSPCSVIHDLLENKHRRTSHRRVGGGGTVTHSVYIPLSCRCKNSFNQINCFWFRKWSNSILKVTD